MSSDPRRSLGIPVVWLAGLWLATGACFKLLEGTPSHLPEIVRSVVLDASFDLGLAYKIFIAIELSVAVLALTRPRWAWPFLVGALVLFDVILSHQIKSGVASCGCLGSSVEMPPTIMLMIDSAFLIALLLANPWRMSDRFQAHVLLIPPAIAVVSYLPWYFDREHTGPPPKSTNGSGHDDPPQALRPYKIFYPEQWVGKKLEDTDLAKFLGDQFHTLVPWGVWILWRWDCSECATHLEDLALRTQDYQFIVLIRLKQPKDTEANKQVHVLPAGPNVFHAELADTMDYSVKTPVEIIVNEDGVVTRATLK